MKTRKRVLSLILALLLAAALAVPVSAEGGKINANIHWFDVEAPEGYELVTASYVKEFGILSCMFEDPNATSFLTRSIVVNIDLATGKQTHEYGDYLIYPFNCGCALIDDSSSPFSSYGYMDLTGKVFAKDISFGNHYHNGYASIATSLYEDFDGFIDVNGNKVYTFHSDRSTDNVNFSDGVAILYTEEGKCTAIDTQFNCIIEPGKYDSISSFSNGMAVAEKDEESYLINKSGELVYPNVYNKGFREVRCTKPNELICVNQNGKWGFTNQDGEVVIPFQYYNAREFSDGLAYVEFYVNRELTYGFIDETGKLVFTLDFTPFYETNDGVYSDWMFQNGYLVVYREAKNEDWTYTNYFTLIDKTGKICGKWVRSSYVQMHENGVIESDGLITSHLLRDFSEYFFDMECNLFLTAFDPDYKAIQVISSVEPYVDWEYFAVIENGRIGWFNFEEDYLGAEKKQPQVSDLADVHPGDWYYDIVKWAVENEITDPLTDTSFGVEVPASREEIVMDLWRACKCPEPLGTVSPFIDVTPVNEGYKAILWAYENSIVNGVGDDRFDPSGTLTRADAATILWRAASNPEPASATYPFQDIPAGVYYEKPVVWAYENGIANGTSANSATFSPDDNVLREQMVAFLYRWLVQPAK